MNDDQDWENDPMVNLIWSDPGDQVGFTESDRGVGHFFGPDVTA